MPVSLPASVETFLTEASARAAVIEDRADEMPEQAVICRPAGGVDIVS
jgi:hypothetical protein